jgi:hypothetical protein
MKSVNESTKIRNKVSRLIDTHQFHLGGSLASNENNLLIKQAIVAWVLLPMELVGTIFSWEQLMSYIQLSVNHLIKIDFQLFLELMNAGYYTVIDSNSTLHDFKDRVTADGWIILRPIHSLIYEWYSLKGDTEVLRSITTFMRFLTKLTFKLDSLEKSALKSFIDTESRIRGLDLSGNPYIPQLQSILKMWLKDFRIDILPVRHGSGSVAEGSLSKADKYKCLSYDNLLYHQFRFAAPGTLELYFPFGARYDNIDRTSRVKFVPKSATKLRTICMEPCTLQYFQQGIMRELYYFISKHPFLSQKIVLNDQTQNQSAARFGSMLNNYATIDLSSASDSVSWQLVKLIFRGTKYLSWAAATRSSRHLLPDGSVMKSCKFAPMGSALCFPTECLIFCAVVELVARKHDCTRTNENSYSFYTVYGDDIACPSDWAQEVISILESIGFLVNNEKSYIHGEFRESCGKEYYRGNDITPIYYRLSAIKHCLTAPDFARFCSLANNAFDSGYTYLRSYAIDSCIHLKKDRKPRSYVDSPAFTECLGKSPMIYSSHPTNFHLSSMRDDNLQVGYWRYLTVSSRDEYVEDSIVADTINYFEFLVESRLKDRRPIDPVPKSVVPKRACWTQARLYHHFM